MMLGRGGGGAGAVCVCVCVWFVGGGGGWGHQYPVFLEVNCRICCIPFIYFSNIYSFNFFKYVYMYQTGFQIYHIPGSKMSNIP